MKKNSELLEKIKVRWRKLKYIRPAFWWLYRRRPAAYVRKIRTRHWRRKVFPEIYHAEAVKGIDERLAVFIELRYDHLSDNLRLIYERMSADARFDAEAYCTNSSQKRRFELYEDMKTAIARMGRAKYVFISDGSAVIGSLPLRRETVLVQVWHACGAFKRFGMSTAKLGLTFGASEKTQMKYPPYGNVNFITVSSPEVAWAYAEAMNRPLEYVHATGVARTDLFYDVHRKQQAFEALYERFPAAKGKKVILFAPTYRGHVRTCTTVDKLRVDLFAEALKDEYVLVIKHHPLVKDLPEIPAEYDGTFAIDVTRDMDITDLLFTSDICITDYSSLIYEYSLFERPMIFFAYDLEEYYDWRGFYYPYEELTPGPVCRTNEEMLDYIRHIDERFDRGAVHAFKERFMSACDGHATDRIIASVTEEGSRRRKRRTYKEKPENKR